MLLPPLKYSEVSLGNAKLQKRGDHFSLYVNDHKWMSYSTEDFHQVYQFQLEATIGKGSCLVTGLGLGILTLLLAQKKDVTTVTVYELNRDIIDMFYYFCNENKIDPSIVKKIVIVEQDANTIIGKTFDYGFFDHFEQEDEHYIVDKVRKLALNNNIKNIWFWPLGDYYLRWCTNNKIDITCESLIRCLSYINIKNIFSDITPLTHYYIISGYSLFDIPFFVSNTDN